MLIKEGTNGDDDVKRKFVILSLVLVCYVFAGCSVSSDESSSISVGAETVTEQDDPIKDISKIEQIFVDE